MNVTGDFERELERELHRVLDPIAAVPIPPRRSPASRGITRRLLGGAGAALGVKLLTGFGVAAFAAAAAGAVTEIAVTGSLNPATWARSVHDQYVPPAVDNHQSTSSSSQDSAKDAGAAGGATGGTSNGITSASKGGSTATGNGSGTGPMPAEPLQTPGTKHPGPTPIPVGPPVR